MSLKITRASPWKLPTWLAGGLLILMLTAWIAYGFGVERGAMAGSMLGEDIALTQAHNDRLLMWMGDLENRNRDLRGRLAIAEQSARIETQASGEVQTDLVALRAELLAAREKLEFYRGIVSPADARGGLRLHRFGLHKVRDEVFGYEVVMVQAKHHDRLQIGRVKIRLHGLQASAPSAVTSIGEAALLNKAEDIQPRTLTFQDISIPRQEEIRYGFRYFQSFSGELMLPENFSPTRVEVEVRPDRKQGPTLRKSFDWAALLAVSDRTITHNLTN